jgi:hypothetical protein
MVRFSLRQGAPGFLLYENLSRMIKVSKFDQIVTGWVGKLPLGFGARGEVPCR